MNETVPVTKGWYYSGRWVKSECDKLFLGSETGDFLIWDGDVRFVEYRETLN